jgi:hypothetical protein
MARAWGRCRDCVKEDRFEDVELHGRDLCVKHYRRLEREMKRDPHADKLSNEVIASRGKLFKHHTALMQTLNALRATPDEVHAVMGILAPHFDSISDFLSAGNREQTTEGTVPPDDQTELGTGNTQAQGTDPLEHGNREQPTTGTVPSNCDPLSPRRTNVH